MCLRAKNYKDKEKLIKTRNAQRKRYYKQTQGNKPRIWTDLEINLILNSNLTDRELANKLKRSVQAIQGKRYRCKSIAC